MFRKILPELFVACGLIIGVWKLGQAWREQAGPTDGKKLEWQTAR